MFSNTTMKQMILTMFVVFLPAAITAEEPKAPTSAPASQPTTPSWGDPINCTLMFPRGVEASVKTLAYWKHMQAALPKAREFVGQMRVLEVLPDEDKSIVMLAQVETGRKDVITWNGVAYIVALNTEKISVDGEPLKRGDTVVFYGIVTRVDLERVTNRQLSDTELMDGYEITIHVDERESRMGKIPTDPTQHTNPNAKDTRMKLRKLKIKHNQLQKRSNVAARQKRPNRKLLSRLRNELNEIQEERETLTRRSQVDELKWELLGKDHSKGEEQRRNPPK